MKKKGEGGEERKEIERGGREDLSWSVKCGVQSAKYS